MKLSLLILILLMVSNSEIKNHSIDFGSKRGGQDWYVVNDGVMGGLSSSSISFTDTSMIFKGDVSLQNNGGFASVRSSRKKMDLSKYKTVTIRFRSPNRNRKFALRLKDNDVYYRPSYNFKFQSKSDDWQELTTNLTDFKETIMGRETDKIIGQKNLQNLIRLGIMLNDKKEGPFTLEIDSIIFN